MHGEAVEINLPKVAGRKSKREVNGLLYIYMRGSSSAKGKAERGGGEERRSFCYWPPPLFPFPA